MFCFNHEAYTCVAGNVSAAFLCPEITPQNAPCEEQNLFHSHIIASLSGDTPADVLTAESWTEYQLNSGCAECTLAVFNPLENEQDTCAFVPENITSEDTISIKADLSEDPSPVFHFRKHISSGFYITVCNSDYLLPSADVEFVVCNKYCCCAAGFVPYGMELKIVIQSFNL